MFCGKFIVVGIPTDRNLLNKFIPTVFVSLTLLMSGCSAETTPAPDNGISSSAASTPTGSSSAGTNSVEEDKKEVVDVISGVITYNNDGSFTDIIAESEDPGTDEGKLADIFRTGMPDLFEKFEGDPADDAMIMRTLNYYLYYFVVTGSMDKIVEVDISEDDVIVEGDSAKIRNNNVRVSMDGEDMTKYRETDDPGYHITLKKQDGNWVIQNLDIDWENILN